VAERSGDTAFARAGRERTNEDFRPHASGVALRFPPQSKTSVVLEMACTTDIESANIGLRRNHCGITARPPTGSGSQTQFKPGGQRFF
jgi:hypothetical protein